MEILVEMLTLLPLSERKRMRRQAYDICMRLEQEATEVDALAMETAYHWREMTCKACGE